MFVHWSNQKAEYRDMESREIHCQQCNKTTQHTFRYHITKTKHYSVVSVGPGKKDISLVCHVCLSETEIPKNDSKELIKQYDNEIAVGEANELMSKGKDSKAEGKLKKVLKRDPGYGQALYSMSKCLISQARYGEAKSYIKNLEDKFPNAPEIKELQDELPPELDTIEPKKEVISRVNDPDMQEVTAVLNNNTNENDPDDRNSNTQSEEMCSHCYHEKKLHSIDLSQTDVNPNLLDSAGRACIGCKDDHLTELCKEFSETSNNKQVTSNNDNILNEKDVIKSEDLEQLEEKLNKEKMDKKEVAEYLELIETLQKVGLGNSNTLIEVKQMLIKNRGLDKSNLQYLTELDIQLSKKVNEITKSVEKAEKDREERQKETDVLKKTEEKKKRLEELKRQAEEKERKLEEKKRERNSKKVKEAVKTNKSRMNLSKIDECLLFNHELDNATNYVIEQFGDDAGEELHNIVFANTTDEEWKSFQTAKKTITELFVRRRYDVWNFMITEEAVKEMYPDGPPPIVNVDHNILPPETLQLGLYLFWQSTSVVKDENEYNESFERRKDWHDFLNGYVNQEAIQRPLIDIAEIVEELDKKREIIKNYIGIMVRSRNR